MKAPPTLLPLWLLAATALPLAATAQNTPPDSAATYKHQLGLTASPVLDGFFKNNRALPVGLLYKRQTKPNQALRLGLVLDLRNERRNKSSDLAANPTFYENSFGLQAYIGREWQRSIARRWVAYAGLDVGAGYDRFRRRDEAITAINVDGGSALFLRKSDYAITTYSTFLRPLIAVRYQVKPYLYLSAESVISVRYSHRSFQDKNSINRVDSNSTDGANTNTQNNAISIFLNPVSQVALHYCFGSTER
ncbi:hypothetical protein CDA63_08465 [Hymenobacter amundsenii]|uniref:Outer membrane protein beta-barrel domain-containing protein n=1 Tax=Hymenobacter amundsenii TaxID=2006685 RepID=A0A246FLK6_9BACT|nr:hypothetical protein [Hymenobacter amundsenii]OWP63602.1 hypothetical protein CDA63_08465 [Hymenobacter amundsenii]